MEEQVFQTENYSEILFKGPVIALELSSTSSISTSPSVHSVITSGTPNSSSVNKDLSTINNCCRRTQNLLRALDTLEEKVIYISDSPLTALEQVDLIFNSANWICQVKWRESIKKTQEIDTVTLSLSTTATSRTFTLSVAMNTRINEGKKRKAGERKKNYINLPMSKWWEYTRTSNFSWARTHTERRHKHTYTFIVTTTASEVTTRTIATVTQCTMEQAPTQRHMEHATWIHTDSLSIISFNLHLLFMFTFHLHSPIDLNL